VPIPFCDASHIPLKSYHVAIRSAISPTVDWPSRALVEPAFHKASAHKRSAGGRASVLECVQSPAAFDGPRAIKTACPLWVGATKQARAFTAIAEWPRRLCADPRLRN
jgi:hypothetical protein